MESYGSLVKATDIQFTFPLCSENQIQELFKDFHGPQLQCSWTIEVPQNCAVISTFAEVRFMYIRPFYQ